jgi:hypothetical protein
MFISYRLSLFCVSLRLELIVISFQLQFIFTSLQFSFLSKVDYFSFRFLVIWPFFDPGLRRSFLPAVQHAFCSAQCTVFAIRHWGHTIAVRIHKGQHPASLFNKQIFFPLCFAPESILL